MSKFNLHDLSLSKEDESEPYHHDGDLALAVERPRLQRPPMFKVLMLNDDYTPMDFVVETLERFFSMDTEQATRVMLQVHTEGQAVCGVFTRDIAETKAVQVNQWAEENEHPLSCEIEVADDEQ